MNKDELRKQTRTQLLALAKQVGLKGVSRLRKAKLIAALVQDAPVGSPLRARPSLAPTARPSAGTRAGKQGKSSAPATRASHALAVTEQPGNTSVAQPMSAGPQEAHAAIDAKFFLGPADQPAPAPAPALPSTYDDNRLVLLARDPCWLYAYWDFSVEQMSAAQTRLGAKEVQMVLRVFDVTYVDFNGANAWSQRDIELSPFATNWYIPVPQPDAAYCVEVSYRTPAGRFTVLGRSNVVTTPRVEASPSTTLRWMTSPGRPPSSLPPRSAPLPLSSLGREESSWPPRPAGREAAAPFSAPSSSRHPFSWNAAHKA